MSPSQWCDSLLPLKNCSLWQETALIYIYILTNHTQWGKYTLSKPIKSSLSPSAHPSLCLLWNQMLLLRLRSFKAPASSSSYLPLVPSSICKASLHPPSFTNLSLQVPSLEQITLLWGSQSNNTVLETEAIIKSSAHPDLTSLTPLIP